MSPSTLAHLTAEVITFRDAREWKQFHAPKDLAISLSLEASEVLELFQWKDATEPAPADRLGEELSDVLYWTLLLAHERGIDLEAAFKAKMKANAAKYPVAKAKGSAKKYTEL